MPRLVKPQQLNVAAEACSDASFRKAADEAS
jgi:hypothetical protein